MAFDVAMDRWGLKGPAARTFKNGQTFKHESDCPVQDNMVGACNCYVSRIRLIETPIGEVIATTEPDLRPEARFWQDRSDRLSRSNKVLSTLLIASAATGITTLVAFAVEAGLF